MDRGQGHSTSDGTHPVAAGLGLIGEGVELVLSARTWSMSDTELLGSVQELATLRARADAAHLHLLREIEARGAARTTGASSTAGWLRSALRLSPGRAKADVDAARITDPERGELAGLGAALAHGEVSRDHVDVGTRVLHKIPMHLRDTSGQPRAADGSNEADGTSGSDGQGAEGVDTATEPPPGRQVDEWLVRRSREYSPLEVARLSRHLLAVLDPSGRDRFDPKALERRYFRLGVDATGMMFGSFQLDPSATIVKVMLDFLSAPDPGSTVDSVGTVERPFDRRTPDQRRADGFVETAKLAAAQVRGVRTRGAEPPLVLVHASPAQLAEAFAVVGPPGERVDSSPLADLPPRTQAGGAFAGPAGLATCEQTGPLAPWVLRRLACGATGQLLAMSEQGAPLWLGPDPAVRLA